MINQFIAFGFDYFLLSLFDLFIVKLEHLATVHTDNVIMVLTIIQFEYCMTAIKIVANHQAGIFKLGQNPVDSRQTHIIASIHQAFIDILGTHVTWLGRLQDLHYLDPGQGDLQPGLAQLNIFRHNKNPLTA